MAWNKLILDKKWVFLDFQKYNLHMPKHIDRNIEILFKNVFLFRTWIYHNTQTGCLVCSENFWDLYNSTLKLFIYENRSFSSWKPFATEFSPLLNSVNI